MKVYSLRRGRVLIVGAVMLALFTVIAIRIVSLAASIEQAKQEVHHLPKVEVDQCKGYCLPGRPLNGQQEI